MLENLEARKQKKAEEEANKTPEEKDRDSFNFGRHILYILGGISLLNLFLIYIEGGKIIILAPAVPYMLYPIAQAMDAVNGTDLASSAMTIGILISFIYPICGLICKKKPAGALAAIVFYILDTILMFVLAYKFMDLWHIIKDTIAHGIVLLFLFAIWEHCKEYFEKYGR